MSSLRAQLIQRLQRLGVVERRTSQRGDGFASLFFEGQEFAHFHNASELDLRLGRDLIRRERLVHPTDSRVHPKRSKNSQWLEIRITRPADVEQAVRLVKLAIEAL